MNQNYDSKLLLFAFKGLVIVESNLTKDDDRLIFMDPLVSWFGFLSFVSGTTKIKKARIAKSIKKQINKSIPTPFFSCCACWSSVCDEFSPPSASRAGNVTKPTI